MRWSVEVCSLTGVKNTFNWHLFLECVMWTPVDCGLSMWGKIMIPVYKLWLHGLYGLYGPRCPLSPERPLNLITHSLTHLCSQLLKRKSTGMELSSGWQPWYSLETLKQRLQWIPELSPWRPVCFSVLLQFLYKAAPGRKRHLAGEIVSNCSIKTDFLHPFSTSYSM